MSSAVLVLIWPGMLANAQTAGVAPEWDTQKMLTELAAQAQRFKPLIEEAKPSEWVSQGAPDAYVAQLRSATAEVGYLIRSAGELARQPDRLTKTIETYFRMLAVESMLTSLAEGIRRYQNPALADLLRSAVSDSTAYREKLRQHLVDLAAVKEAEFQVADREAQRCRAVLSRQPGSRK